MQWNWLHRLIRNPYHQATTISLHGSYGLCLWLWQMNYGEGMVGVRQLKHMAKVRETPNSGLQHETDTQ